MGTSVGRRRPCAQGDARAVSREAACSRPGESSSPVGCGCLPTRAFGFPLDSEVGGQTLALRTFLGAALPADRGGNRAPAPHSGWRCHGVWGSPLRRRLCSVSVDGRSAWGLGRRLAGQLSVRAWFLGGQRAAFQPLLGPTSCLGEKTERPLAGNGPLPTAFPPPPPRALACGERPLAGHSPGWAWPAPSFLLRAQEQTRSLSAMRANPTQCHP